MSDNRIDVDDKADRAAVRILLDTIDRLTDALAAKEAELAAERTRNRVYSDMFDPKPVTLKWYTGFHPVFTLPDSTGTPLPDSTGTPLPDWIRVRSNASFMSAPEGEQPTPARPGFYAERIEDAARADVTISGVTTAEAPRDPLIQFTDLSNTSERYPYGWEATGEEE